MPGRSTDRITQKRVDSPDDPEHRDFFVDLDAASIRWLADHRVQDICVVPGALYIDFALRAAGRDDLSGVTIRDIRFEQVLVVDEGKRQETSVKMIHAPGADADLVTCLSAVAEDQWTRHASLSIRPAQSVVSPAASRLSPEDTDIAQHRQLTKEVLYRRLEGNGNQYGPSFQCIDAVSIGPDECLAAIRLPAAADDGWSRHGLHPILLDACAQSLAAIKLDLGKTFLLEGIGQIDIFSLPADDFRILARLTAEHEGRAEVIDADGTCLLRLEGIRFRHLDRAQVEANDDRSDAEPMAVAATFTAEPLEETLRFWSKAFEIGLMPRFAPFNQVFQELLDPRSLLASNRAGANAIVLRLEDWAQNVTPKNGDGTSEARKGAVDADETYTLPNQLEIAHINPYETEYLFKEIFVDRCYVRHGISLDGAECVIDIGANIGMFTMFVQQQCPDARVFSFEPGPKVFQALEANSRLLNDRAKVHNCGVSDKTGEATFTYYDKSTVFSTFSADQADDQAAIRAVIENAVQDDQSGEQPKDEVDGIVDGLLGERLEAKTMTCPLVSLSEVIRDNQIERIDLLKVDAEKSELAILSGIDEADWPKIQQIVIEVHDKVGDVIEAVVALLKRHGFTFEMTEEDLLRNSGLYNIYATREADVRSPAAGTALTGRDRMLIEQTADDFVDAVQSFADRSKLPTIVAFSAPSVRLAENAAAADYLARIEADIIARLSGSSEIHTLSSAQIQTRYPVADYYDAAGDQAGRVPYTPAYYSALATGLFRQYHAARRSPFKAIVLDCDNTLWKGVCGEVGPEGVELDPPRLALQTFVKKKIGQGMVVCLCSKNVEEDVRAVFEARDDMILSLDDIVASRINWRPKSANLTELAEELNLGLDSFVMIDDSAIECAEIRANCPAALTLQLPIDDAGTIPRFLDHVWAFDQVAVTDEGRKRTKLYKENAAREGLRANTMSLSDFLAKLNLDIRIEPMRPENLERVADLTRRTNQFNVSTIRRNSGEIKALTDSGRLECLVTTVRDRFGDYGLVGVMMIETTDDALVVDTMLLSCRVLGRGVEHRMLALVGERAVEKERARVDIPYRPTAKSVPAGHFLDAVGADYREADGADNAVYRIPADRLATLTFKPEEASQPADGGDKQEPVMQPLEGAAGKFHEMSEKIASELWDAERLAELGKDAGVARKRPDLATMYRAPKTDLERKIAAVWTEVLGLDKVGAQDNFFELGGTSLKAVQLIASLNRELSLQVPIVTLFAEPTVTALARANDTPPANDQTTDSQQRGAARRKAPIRRRRR